MPRTPTPWNLHVKKVWEENKHKPGYKFKQALKDAAKSWKNGAKTKRSIKSLDMTEENEPIKKPKKKNHRSKTSKKQ